GGCCTRGGDYAYRCGTLCCGITTIGLYLELSEMYLSFYRLREEPFRLTPDPRFFHLAEVHRTVLVELLRGVVCRRGFMVVTGPVGTGKTTLLHTAMGILSAKYAVDNK